MASRDLADEDERNVVLTGFMGTGKSTVGRMLAERLAFEFIDTDAIIEDEHGAIPEIFRQQGEEGFRRIERAVAAEVADRRRRVISTGGRMMLDPVNVRSLSRNGRVFCLVASPDAILERVTSGPQATDRPLLAGPDPRRRVLELLTSREAEYRRFAQLTTEARSPESVADDLVTLSRTRPRRIEITGPAGSYDYLIGAAVLPCVRELTEIKGQLVLITSGDTSELFRASVPAADLTIELPPGPSRNDEIERQRLDALLFDAKIDSSATILSLGDHEIGHIAAAASSRLGADWMHCPTDLAAMIDSPISGTEQIPKAVVADVVMLQNLDLSHAAPDVAATLRHSPTVSANLLAQLERNEWRKDGHSLPGALGDLESLVAQAVSGDW